MPNESSAAPELVNGPSARGDVPPAEHDTVNITLADGTTKPFTRLETLPALSGTPWPDVLTVTAKAAVRLGAESTLALEILSFTFPSDRPPVDTVKFKVSLDLHELNGDKTPTYSPLQLAKRPGPPNHALDKLATVVWEFALDVPAGPR